MCTLAVKIFTNTRYDYESHLARRYLKSGAVWCILRYKSCFALFVYNYQAIHGEPLSQNLLMLAVTMDDKKFQKNANPKRFTYGTLYRFKLLIGPLENILCCFTTTIFLPIMSTIFKLYFFTIFKHFLKSMHKWYIQCSIF